MKKTTQRASATAEPDRDWQVENDYHTLTRAEEIRMDGQRFRAARRLGKRQLSAAQRALRSRRG